MTSNTLTSSEYGGNSVRSSSTLVDALGRQRLSTDPSTSICATTRFDANNSLQQCGGRTEGPSIRRNQFGGTVGGADLQEQDILLRPATRGPRSGARARWTSTFAHAEDA
jgi:hypothetical protein